MSSFRRRLMMAQGLGGGRTPDNASDGVYIQDLQGFLYTIDEWNLPNEEANGIAVISIQHPNRGFVIYKNSNGYSPWGQSKMISGIVTTEDPNIAKTDYAGYSNSIQMMSQDSTSLAKSCIGYTFPNGKKGYLGALGEWTIAYNNKSAIVKCMSKIGGYIGENYYWSSTQCGKGQAWAFSWSDCKCVPNPKVSGCTYFVFSVL